MKVGEAAGPRAVAIVTDSTSDIHRDVAGRYGIDVVRLLVTVGGETFEDGELSSARLIERMDASPEPATTSQPAAATFIESYRAALERAEHVVSVHISSRLSGTVGSARLAAAEFGDRVSVIDSRNLSWGLGFQVLEGAKAAAGGSSVEAVVAAVESARDRVRMLVGVDSLEYLRKGGRIGMVSAFLGGLLDVKVTFTVDAEGAFAPVARSRGKKAAIRQTLEWVASQMEGRTKGSFCVPHADSPDTAEVLRRALEESYEVDEMFVVETGAVISAHTGTGWAVALLPAE